MARRGLLAEIHHQVKVAAREQAREQARAERAQKAAIKEAERIRKEEERAALQQARSDAIEQKRLAKKKKDAHIAAMESEVEEKNIELSQLYSEIDSLLAATLDVDDYVDLDTLRTVAEHPPFDRADLEEPIPLPAPIPDPQKPDIALPDPPKGIRGLLGKKKHAKAIAKATYAHEGAVAKWQTELAKLESVRKDAATKHAEMEAERISELEKEHARYVKECSARAAAVVEHNKAVDMLKANLGYGDVDAVQEYISIVLSNSVYPSHFPVEHEFDFNAKTAELRLRVCVSSSDKLPDVNAYKYKKSSDEITSTALSQKAKKDRYAGAVHQVALRSIHEVFEADRRGIIQTISLEVGTETVNPATGKEGFILFVAVGSERESFLGLNLSNVVPAATLSHLGASVSKNPFGLVAANASGVRRS